jgi:hypothetical protein
VIDQLSATATAEHACVLFLYCDYRDERQQTTENLIGALLKQAIRLNPASSDAIIEELHKMMKKENQVLKADAATKFLIAALLHFAKIYICIDALDECQDDRASFLHSLSDLFKHTELQKRLRIFFTGRPQVAHYVEKQLVGPSFCTVILEDTEEDILKYVRNQIQNDDGGLDMSDGFTNQIISTIRSTSDGM